MSREDLAAHVGVLVASHKCSNCLFTPERIVQSAQVAADMSQECIRKGTHFLCHKGTVAGLNVMCHGSYLAHDSQILQVSTRLGKRDGRNYIRMVDPDQL